MRTVFLLAHQDDEVFVLPRISLEIAASRSVFCVFLTGAGTALSRRRRRESTRVLLGLGVTADQLWFLGDELEVPDGRLVERAADVVRSLMNRLGQESVEAIYAPAWEGGHQDHDACCWIADRLACGFVVRPNVMQFPLYHGECLLSGFYHVMLPLIRQRKRVVSRRLSWREVLRVIVALPAYRTQLVTWLGLAPGLLWRLVSLRREVFIPLEVGELERPPHDGILLYERWGRMRAEDFTREMQRQEGLIRDALGRPVAARSQL